MKVFIIITLTFCYCSVSGQVVLDSVPKGKIDQAVRNPFTKALIIYQNGKLVYEYGNTRQPYQVFSIRKSLLSILYGIYAHEGKIDLNATLEELDINDKQHLTNNEREARVVDLLKARSGVFHPAAYETTGMVKNRPQRGQYKPGEYWYYNNWDFNALTTIFEKLTGKSVFDAFEERLARPLGMKDFDLHKQKYFSDSVSYHRVPLWAMSASDLSLLGLLLLDNGKWSDATIIPSAWISESTTSYSDLGMLGGYGYCWWVAKDGNHFPFVKLPDGSYSARGTGEQTLLIIPAIRMVIVHLTEINSPEDPMMKVTDFGRLLKVVLD